MPAHLAANPSAGLLWPHIRLCRRPALFLLTAALVACVPVGGQAVASNLQVAASASAAPPLAPHAPQAVQAVGREIEVDNFAIYIPSHPAAPAPVFLALHGMGGNGSDVRAAFEQQAEVRGWIVVAPTFSYGNWWDPARLTSEASEQLPRSRPSWIGSPI